MSKERPISPTLKIVLNIGLNALGRAFDRINLPILTPLLMSILLSMRLVVDALSDSNPNNDEQLKAIQIDSIQTLGNAYTQFAKDNLSAKIPDENLKNGTILLLDRANNVIKILTDENPNDGDQLREMVEEYDVITLNIAKNFIIDKLKDSDKLLHQTIVEGLEALDMEDIVDPV